MVDPVEQIRLEFKVQELQEMLIAERTARHTAEEQLRELRGPATPGTSLAQTQLDIRKALREMGAPNLHPNVHSLLSRIDELRRLVAEPGLRRQLLPTTTSGTLVAELAALLDGGGQTALNNLALAMYLAGCKVQNQRALILQGKSSLERETLLKALDRLKEAMDQYSADQARPTQQPKTS